ncbi:M73 family metallopeptidase [Fictibacillus nanhaiensis]|uniref:CalY family protein n=1 Tax=Fictibacillus nanhaiensis TaxID=742169 RepID=UPI001C984A1E|nr:CalY family protein [Fictibacillus nanhaiensis]MBY6037207.1 M73 family metallopeptidase [Fictibacillus nanhaiensis]
MSLKKRLGLGVASAALGLSLVGGGTYAYFSDSEVTNNTFAAGTLDLSVDPTTIIDVNNLKPGDTMLRTFELVNGGTLDIKNVVLNTTYTVNSADVNASDLGDHIRVNFLFNVDKLDVPIWSTTLAELKNMDPKVVKNKFETMFGDQWGTKGLVAGSSDLLFVQFEFVDNGKDQNEFQGDSLSLEWKFDAKQKAGEER